MTQDGGPHAGPSPLFLGHFFRGRQYLGADSCLNLIGLSGACCACLEHQRMLSVGDTRKTVPRSYLQTLCHAGELS
jgi:hypothetical protein